MPELRYMKGDSVSLTIAESKEDFDYLVGDHQRDSSKFHSLLPQLPEPFVTSDDVQVSPVLALQVTMFPNSGVSIGHTFLHAVGDGSAFMNFNKLWTSINKLELLQASSRPLYDRSVVQDPFHLGRKIFNEVKLLKSYNTPRIPSPKISKDEVRATFILHRSDIMKLKSSISNNVSTFNLTCALIWTCLSKSLDVVTEGKVEEDKCENICVFINCRERFDPPIPHNYFGNCIVPCIVGLTHGQLVGNEGLSVAATTIRDAIHKRVRDNEGILRGDWFSYSHTRSAAVTPGKLVIVGSIQRNGSDYNDNFGWGELVKHEWVSANDSSANVSFLTLSGRFEGAIEIGISLPKNRMDAFTTSCKICVNGPM